MKEEVFQFSYSVYDSQDELNDEDRKLLMAALDATTLSHAPYSQFRVGAAAKLTNGEIVKGGNQENVSFPAGVCAEGVVLAVAASQFPDASIETLAISYRTSLHNNDHPISPCGICRQTLDEYRNRFGSPVRLIMGGAEGKVFVINDASVLMPLAFRF